MADIFDEIRRDMKDEKYERLIIQHGPKLLIAALVVVVVFASFNFYRSSQEEFSKEVGAEFYQAFENNNFDKYQDVIKSGHEGYKFLSLLNKASMDYTRERYSAAIKSLLQVSEDKSADKIYRQAADLIRAKIMIENNADYSQIITVLDGLTDKDSYFRDSALEVKGVYLAEIGKNEEAKKVLESLAFEGNVLPTVQERAKKLLKVYNL